MTEPRRATHNDSREITLEAQRIRREVGMALTWREVWLQARANVNERRTK